VTSAQIFFVGDAIQAGSNWHEDFLRFPTRMMVHFFWDVTSGRWVSVLQCIEKKQCFRNVATMRTNSDYFIVEH